jgi:hypothetical protein
MQSYSSYESQPLPPVNSNSLSPGTAVGNTVISYLLILFPICLVLGAVLQKRYRTYRTTVLCQQIEMLERLWRISSNQ